MMLSNNNGLNTPKRPPFKIRFRQFVTQNRVPSVLLGLPLAIAFKPRGFKVWSYLKADFCSELTREPSEAYPTKGFRGFAIKAEKLRKTIRDFFTFSYNYKFLNHRKFYDIQVDKSSNHAHVFHNDSVHSNFRVSTGRDISDKKLRHGHCVTPVGEYIVIAVFNKEEMFQKFRHRTAEDGTPLYELYGEGMLQLWGKWSPYINLHGVRDENWLGTNASRGCINIPNENIRLLVETVGIGSRVIVY